MCYITQSASRLMRSLFEISLKKKWSYVSYRCLTICKMIKHRMWSIESPLRQFGINNPLNKLTYSIISRIEKCQFSFKRFLYLSSEEIGELIRMPSVGKDIYNLIHKIPKLNLRGQIQPITRSIIKIELNIESDFFWDNNYHGNSQEFWIIVEDVNSEYILYSEYFILYKKLLEEKHILSFTIPIYQPLPPQYFIRVTSDKWLGSTTILPISFRNLILPTKYKEKTELLDLQPLPINKLKFYNFINIKSKYFTSIQTQVFNKLYNTNDNILICSPTFSGKTTCGEITIIKMFNDYPNGRCIYIVPNKYLAKKQYNKWIKIFNQTTKGINVNLLLDDNSIINNVKLINKSRNIIISTPINYDKIQRGWRKRKCIQNVNLIIFDNIHFIGINNNKFNGSIYEIIVSRQRYIISLLDIPTRIIALSLSISNAKDIGLWINCKNNNIFNFDRKTRKLRYTILIKPFDINNFESRHISYTKPCYEYIKSNTFNSSSNSSNSNSSRGGTIIFVSSRKHCRRLSSDIVALSCSENKNFQFLSLNTNDFKPYLNKLEKKGLLNKNSVLYKCLLHGIGFIHNYTDESIKSSICKFYKSGAIKILIVVSSLCYNLELYDLKKSINITSKIILYGTKYYCGLSHNYIDYELSDIIQMMSYINSSDGGLSYILCHSNKQSFYKKFLISDSYPIESSIDYNNNLEDIINSEIISGTINNADDAIDFLTWTYYYCRLIKNPNYYNLRGIKDSDLSSHLSELIEESFHKLYNSNCIFIDENMNVSPLNNGLISSYYYITYTTIEFFYKAIKNIKKIKLKNILSVLTYATEFENNISLRKNEENTIKKIARHLPLTINTAKSSSSYTDIQTKVNVLLQTYFMRTKLLSYDINNDLKIILSYTINLLYSIIDIFSTLHILNGTIITIQLCQMIIQSMFNNDNYLLQLPYITKESAKYLDDKYNIKNIYDLLEIDDNLRIEALNKIGINTKEKLNNIAIICNNYPDLDLNFTFKNNKKNDDNDIPSFKENDEITLVITVEKDDEDEDDDKENDIDKSTIKIDIPLVNSPKYPYKKTEAWYLIIGDENENKIIRNKRFEMNRILKIFKIKFKAPKKSLDKPYKYRLYLMSDSYLGCDQVQDIYFNVH